MPLINKQENTMPKIWKREEESTKMNINPHIMLGNKYDQP